jgi:multidrug efflux pump subunit AcrA (membrane-fusion protein)
MQFFLRHRKLVIVFVLLVISGSLYFLTKEDGAPDWVEGTVERGDVRELVSVSGVIEAEGEATLSFPTSGIVSEILVREGDSVLKDQILALLSQDELLAERRDAYANLLIVTADRDELIAGPRGEERDVTKTAVAIAEADLARTKSEEAKKVENAYRTLLSSDLEALPLSPSTEDAAPVITGTYTCGKEGAYKLDIFRSGADSGYSYRLSGLESGTYPAYTESPAPFGLCGLRIQFVAGETYGNRSWEVRIPNPNGTTYTANLNAYLLAQTGEKNGVSASEQALEKALREATLANAIPRDEALARANASVIQAEARLAQIDARMSDRTLRAPFSGVVSDSSLTVGETSEKDALTLVSSDRFVLTVRIPEIDITRIGVNQEADVRFDARPDEIVTALIEFIAPRAIEIDGVAYFEAKLGFLNPPTWLRSGLNADVDVVIKEQVDVLMIPKRFIIEENGESYVLRPEGIETVKEKISVDFIGNNGFVAVSGSIREGDTLIAP